MSYNGITLLDGAVGTSLWEKTDNKVAVWRYNIENPAIVYELQQEYLAAGSEIVQANTFGANRISLRGSGMNIADVMGEAVRICKEAVGGKAKVAMSIGPLTKLLEPFGDLTEQEAYEIYDELITAGMKYKPDIIYFETFIDVELLKIAAKAASKWDAMHFYSMSFGPTGRTMMGNRVTDVIDALSGYPVDAVGLNCSLGPAAAEAVIREFRNNTDLPLIFKPNAGKPIVVGDETKMEFNIDDFVEDCSHVFDCISYVGGCCGSNPSYIKALADRLKNI